MKTQIQVKKMIAIACVTFGLATVAAPKVKIDKIESTSVWSTKKVTYTVSGVPADVPNCIFVLAFDVTAYSVTTNINKVVARNGTFTATLDTERIFGETRKDPNAKIRVSVERQDLKPVQLWKDGPYFAPCNVGATRPEEDGYYFWWGDTVGYKHDGSKWVSVADGTTSIEFSDKSPANSTIMHDNAWLKNNGWIGEDGYLVAAHDAATAHLGPPWMMPSSLDLENLQSKCTTLWTTDWMGTGKAGCVVTGNTAGYTNKSIFLPAAGGGGLYWSSTPVDNSYDLCYAARSLVIGSGTFSAYYVLGISGRSARCEGGTVRPVRRFAE